VFLNHFMSQVGRGRPVFIVIAPIIANIHHRHRYLIPRTDSEPTHISAMKFRTQLHRIAEEFARVGVEFGVPDIIGGVLLCVRLNGDIHVFLTPYLDTTYNYRVPGWLLAGIWDLLALPSQEYLPTEDDLRRTQFRCLEPGLWGKPLPADARQQLLYRPATGQFSTRVVGGFAETAAGSWPRTSLFHAQRLFEENHWVSPHEVAVPTQEVARYLTKPQDSLMSLCIKALPPNKPSWVD
jgi:hypothetical protein